MTFHVGDIPATPFVVEPPETVPLESYDDGTASILRPEGAPVTGLPVEIDAEAGTVTIDPPTESPFTVDGIYRLRVILTGPSARVTLPDVRIVAQDPDSEWHTLDTVREDWPDAEDIPDPLLWSVLELARGQILEFGPTLAEDAPVPHRYREGQRVQARNIVTAARVQPDGGMGTDDFVVRPFPLDWHVKQIVRPVTGKPVVA